MAERDVTIRLKIVADTAQARSQLRNLGGDLRGAPAGGGGLQIPGAVWGRGGGSAAAGVGAGNFSMAGGAGEGAAAGGAAAGLAAVASAAAAVVVEFKLMENAVAKANPAVMERFNLAVNDTIAVIGHALVPVMELATEAVRAVGDVFANILPSGQEVRSLMNELRPILNELKTGLMELAPAIKETFVSALRAAAITLHLFNQAIRPVLDALHSARNALGFNAPENPLSSVGAAARPAQQFGNLVSAIEAMNVQALSGAGSIQDQQLSAIKNIDQNVQAMRDAMSLQPGFRQPPDIGVRNDPAAQYSWWFLWQMFGA